jgi:protein-disulfide isomerase
MKNKNFIIIGALFLVVFGFILAAKLYRDSQSEKFSFMAQDEFKTFVPDHAPRTGAANAKVFVVEFLDPECESCREFYPVTKQLLKDFEGKIQLIVRYAPFHDNSELAIRILEAARRQDKYWETLELLFRYQPEWGSHHDPRPDLIWNHLPELNLDLDRLKKDLEDPQITKNLDQDITDGRKLEIRYTPTFFINGKPLEEFGARQLRAAIEAELREP